MNWVQDLAEAKTLAAVLYFVRQLAVYIGKMKPKPGTSSSSLLSLPVLEGP